MRVGVGLIGYGTVGSGFYERFEQAQADIYKETGVWFYIDAIAVKSREKYLKLKSNPDFKDIFITTNAGELIKRESIGVIAEATCGIQPAGELLWEALNAKKNVITANKAALAANWAKLNQEAKRQNVHLCYEASVAAGIPIIGTLKKLVQADEILSLEGVINGTTNYILDRMSRHGESYEEALMKAQAYGYAESEPSADIDGVDAANKLAILTNLCFETEVDPKSIYKESIRHIPHVNMGTRVVAKVEASECEPKPEVRIENLSENHAFYGLEGIGNAIKIKTKGLGCLTFNGPGAGSRETGTAMLLDLTEIAIAYSKNYQSII